jgi:phosphate starvation-inducible PhoH-like protein
VARRQPQLFYPSTVRHDEIIDDPKITTLKHKRQKYPPPLHNASLVFRDKCEAKTAGQQYYLDVLSESAITLCSGPAGCGKTWLVTRVALEMLSSNRVSKIVVTKPIVEAGEESLGYLPGDVGEKVLPHFQSVIDCFEDHLGPMMTKKLIETDKIVFLPTAFCRGRDIKNSFILIDEAQNLTKKGIKLMMTRISDGSVMALNGDSDQIDISPADSGFEWALQRLRGKNPQVGVVELSSADICRHPLIHFIISNLY